MSISVEEILTCQGLMQGVQPVDGHVRIVISLKRLPVVKQALQNSLKQNVSGVQVQVNVSMGLLKLANLITLTCNAKAIHHATQTFNPDQELFIFSKLSSSKFGDLVFRASQLVFSSDKFVEGAGILLQVIIYIVMPLVICYNASQLVVSTKLESSNICEGMRTLGLYSIWEDFSSKFCLGVSLFFNAKNLIFTGISTISLLIIGSANLKRIK